MATNRRAPEPWLRGWVRPLPELPSLVHFNEAQAAPGHRLHPHTHERFELCYLVAGRARWTNPDGVFDVGPGDLYLTAPGEIHDGVADERDPHHNFAIGFDLALGAPRLGDPAGAAAEIDAVEALPPRRRVIPGGGATAPIFRAIARELADLPPTGDPRRSLAVAMLQALMVELAVTATRLAIDARAADHAEEGDLRALEARLRQRLDTPPT
ncbi:MAG: AraC family ligand binding domain-containing protein, partial [Planctomycetes bacterium]|nr:AraC family ligand binding domain-containing protein [Planctomycetota bacterium]